VIKKEVKMISSTKEHFMTTKPISKLQENEMQDDRRGTTGIQISHRFGLKHPHVGVFAHFIPPPQADEDAPADVLDRPEIELQQQNERRM
jgi:hypothetical protein